MSTRISLLIIITGLTIAKVWAQPLFSVGGSPNGFVGTVFSWDVATSTYTAHATFAGSLGYSEWDGRLLYGGGDTFYGTVRTGIASSGAVFKANTANASIEIVHAFSLMDGTAPSYGLAQHNGLIYGTTGNGGALSGGTLFRIHPVTNQFTVLHAFNSSELYNPRGELHITPEGIIYGVANNGGLNDRGAIYSYDLNTNELQLLHHFESATGRSPFSGMTLGPDAKFYGVTEQGGTNNQGVLYSFDPQTNEYIKLRDFQLATGAGPQGQLAFGPNGKIYGTCPAGGFGSQGVLFQVDPDGSNYTVLVNFDSSDLFSPRTAVSFGDDGNIYGLNTFGGSNASGGIYRYNLSTGSYTTLHSLNGNNAHTYSPFVRKEGPGVGVEEKLAADRLLIYPNPAGNEVYINVPSQLVGKQLDVIALDGKICSGIQQTIVAGGSISLNVSSLSSGIYQVVLRDGVTLVQQGRIFVR